MIGLLLTGLLLSQTPAPATPPADAPKAPALSELHTAQVEAHLAKLRALQLEVQLRTLALERERQTLEQAIGAAHPGWRMSWDTGALVPAAKEAPAAKDGTP